MESNRFRITHFTEYRFDEPVFLEPHYLRFHLSVNPFLRVADFSLQVDPAPSGVSPQLDAENNVVHFCWFNGLHDHLSIRLECEVDFQQFDPFNYLVYPSDFLSLPFEYPDPLKATLKPYLQALEISKDVQEYAKRLLKEVNQQAPEFLIRLTQQIAKDFELASREEGDPLDPSDTFRLKSGSCRDLAWMHIHLLRNLGIAARFVSGYFFVEGEKPEFELHAWVDVFLPGAGWIGFDPGHGLAASNSHLAVAKSASFRNTMPVTGSVRGAATSTLAFYLKIELLD